MPEDSLAIGPKSRSEASLAAGLHRALLVAALATAIRVVVLGTAWGATAAGSSVSRTGNVATGSGGAVSWEALALAAAVALFVGGFLGNFIAARRLARPKVSVYDAIRKRIDAEKAGE
jgi:hypothetical protein